MYIQTNFLLGELMDTIFGVSGLRGVIGDGLSPDLIFNYVSSFAKEIPMGTVVIGNDSRFSGNMVRNAVVSSLLALGFKILDIGIAPTPTIQFVTKINNASGGISITASHNPEKWNGLKFIDSNGIFFNEKKINSIKKNLEEKNFKFQTYDKLGIIVEDPKAKEIHINSVLQKINFDCFNNSKLTVAIDACNAAGSEFIPDFIEKLGSNIVKLNCDSNASFPRNPEPLKENLLYFSDFIKQKGNIDVGFALDGDADRVAILDEKGNYIGEENTLVLASKFFIEYLNPPNKTVVTNLSTTRALDDVVASLGGRVQRAKVGEINVVEEMIRVNASIGGEGNGGVILPMVQYARDSLCAISLILLGLSKSKLPLSAIVSELPKYYMIKDKISISRSSFEKNLYYIKEFFKGHQYSDIDGLKFDIDDSWIHIRPSNTEPIVRIIAESKSIEKANNLVEEIKNLMKSPC
ncbi:MAG: putative phosphoglucosamine mutase [Candidatus Methanofastidiosum methylothiophilum]|uniref:Putative phosphoglucosamine mutase n=1 Tax=Candidatus Methanofastidiosum methylothiophilum TaxID=1705564 RepID=A0A150IJW7_9EURY|nr:MAG: putative phosphoglucosamine mutase [Candidatus Methanofastidiosum methylthiophilus]KYC48511.1 MAG: putative phosphoglucosamine mutase [Candidatus Methanofastidiosum methylthiophilus]KYC49662.1 MAG: putative phosphoglucosamine mutase [Candidatus Methanofastidiosum methylthiophilus]